MGTAKQREWNCYLDHSQKPRRQDTLQEATLKSRLISIA
jgi:hypothetical protein